MKRKITIDLDAAYHIAMSRAAPSIVPEESDILCETCGYTLSGLPSTGRCPECGTPIAESAASLRRPPVWEEPAQGAIAAFARASCEVIFHPTRFYRSLATRRDITASRRFAQL